MGWARQHSVFAGSARSEGMVTAPRALIDTGIVAGMGLIKRFLRPRGGGGIGWLREAECSSAGKKIPRVSRLNETVAVRSSGTKG